MAIKPMNFVWERPTPKGSLRMMLLAIADRADDYGVAYPGIENLSKKCAVSVTQGKNLIAELERLGEIGVQVGGGIKANGGSTNRYYLLKYRQELKLPIPKNLRPLREKKKRDPRQTGLPQSTGLTGGGQTGLPRSQVVSLSTTTGAEKERPTIFEVWEQNIGGLTPMISDSLKDWLKNAAFGERAEEAITKAITIAVKANARRLDYVEAVLKRMERDGIDAPRPSKSNNFKTVVPTTPIAPLPTLAVEPLPTVAPGERRRIAQAGLAALHRGNHE